MVALGALGALDAARAWAQAGPPLIPAAQRKFDHDLHLRVSTAGGKPAACAHCHKQDANGAPRAGKEHASPATSRCEACHGTRPLSCDAIKQPGPKSPARLCQTCHVSTRAECLPRDLPAKTQSSPPPSRFTHGVHTTLNWFGQDCVQCHAAQAPAAANTKAGAAHALCARCHNPQHPSNPYKARGAGPDVSRLSMAACESCHTASKVAKAPRAADPFRLAGFDHRRHHAASSQQAACMSCHDKLAGANEAALPRPHMLGCQYHCHDAKRAFATTGTSCTKCHRGSDPPAAMRTDLQFDHAKHATRNVRITDCVACHALQVDGSVDAPLARKDHQPCAASGCHQPEFATRGQTRICGICHDAASPWHKAVARAKKPAVPEWHSTMNHASHLSALRTMQGNAACATCHGDKLAGAPAPKNHAACAPCHTKGQGPPMAQCAACHAQGAVAPRRADSAWSVAANFKHETHAIDLRTGPARKPTPCIDCHAQMGNATSLANVLPPTMGACDAACHNGKIAFKTTGFECARCHTKASPLAMREVTR